MPDSFGSKIKAPTGTIALWNEPLSNIPSGWALCDGNNGTPNLLDRFTRSVSSAEDPGETGGQHSLTLTASQMPNHDHGVTVDSVGDHDITVTCRDNTYDTGNDGYATIGGTKSVETTSNGSHSHTATTSSTGSGNSIDNRPRFHQVAFIQKL
jgi:microcystin-dependent protein